MEIDRNAVQTAIIFGLPGQARWTIGGTSLDFDFSVAVEGLRSLPEDWIDTDVAANLLVFGEQDFAEGGGASPWLCVHACDGFVCGFDGDDEPRVFFLNSSIDQFVATFHLLNESLGKDQPLPSDCEVQLRRIDPEGYPKSEWRLLIEHLRTA